MAMGKREDLVFLNAPAIDVGAMTDDLNALADRRIACGLDVVALESTGVYWIPVHEVHEQRGLKVWLVDARQVEYAPGRKGDVQDCQGWQCMREALVQMNIQVTEVVSDVMGPSGQAIIRDIVAG